MDNVDNNISVIINIFIVNVEF